MQNAPSNGTSPKASSISRRFSYALISIIALLLIVFTAFVILYDINRIESEMQSLQIMLRLSLGLNRCYGYLQKIEAIKSTDTVNLSKVSLNCRYLLCTTGFGNTKNPVIFVSYLQKSLGCDYGKIAPPQHAHILTFSITTMQCFLVNS